MIKHYFKIIFIGLTILLFAVALSGFSNPQPEPVTLYQKDAPRLLVAAKTVEAPVEKPSFVKRTYKKNEQLSPQELKDLLYEVGFRGERLREAWGTAMKESTGRPRSHNKNRDTGDNSFGLFQINMIDSLGPARLEKYNLESNKDLFDPLVNAKIAFQMSNGGKNWAGWNGITDRTLDWMKEFPK